MAGFLGRCCIIGFVLLFGMLLGMQSAPSPQYGHPFTKAAANKGNGSQIKPAQIQGGDISAIDKNNPLSAAGKKLSGSVEGLASKAFGGISSLAVRLTNKNKHR